MTRTKTNFLLFSLCLCASVVTSSVRGDAPPVSTGKASADMATAAKAFLASLSPEQLATAGFDFKDAERMNWHFIPKPRKGLTIKDMSDGQRALAKAMLTTALSDAGNAKVLSIMSLEQVLHDFEKPPAKFPRDPELYYWSIFGQPGGKDAWGWRVEGHHTSVNVTIVNDHAVAASPLFMGDNPAEVREGPKKGLRVLAEEEDMGRALVKTLSEDQMKKALIMQEAPKDIVTAAERQVVMKKFEGLPTPELKDAQKAALMELIGLYANRLRPDLAQDDLKRIAAAGMDKVYFAWAGGTDKGQPHYYRIHGPTFLIEYDDTQNNANHIHTVWRDLENDFGGDVLRRHYEQDHK